MSRLKLIRAEQKHKRSIFIGFVICFVMLVIYTVYLVLTAESAPTPDTILQALVILFITLFLVLLLILPGIYLTRQSEKAALEKADQKKQAWRERQKAKKNERKAKNK